MPRSTRRSAAAGIAAFAIGTTVLAAALVTADFRSSVPPARPTPTVTVTPVVSTQPTPAHSATPDPARIEEDDPRWDCHTMGNRICGPIIPAPPITTHTADPDLDPADAYDGDEPR